GAEALRTPLVVVWLQATVLVEDRALAKGCMHEAMQEEVFRSRIGQSSTEIACILQLSVARTAQLSRVTSDRISPDLGKAPGERGDHDTAEFCRLGLERNISARRVGRGRARHLQRVPYRE